jgi:sugar lactone lactonase YvrE
MQLQPAPEALKSYYPANTRLGECPLYRPEDKTLHYIDVLGNSIHILDLSSHDSTPDRLRTIPCPEPISFMGFCANPAEGGRHQYIVCYFQGIATVNEKDGSFKVLKKIIPDEEKHLRRLNDGAIDSRGRLWFGSLDIPGM